MDTSIPMPTDEVARKAAEALKADRTQREILSKEIVRGSR